MYVLISMNYDILWYKSDDKYIVIVGHSSIVYSTTFFICVEKDEEKAVNDDKWNILRYLKNHKNLKCRICRDSGSLWKRTWFYDSKILVHNMLRRWDTEITKFAIILLDIAWKLVNRGTLDSHWSSRLQNLLRNYFHSQSKDVRTDLDLPLWHLPDSANWQI